MTTDDNECMKTCEVGVLCPHGASCDHIGAGRITPEELEVLFNYMLRKEKELREEVKRLREAMSTMLDDMNNASPEEDIEYWLDTWEHWLMDFNLGKKEASE